MKKNIAILGSTGSIGKQACQIISMNKDKYHVVMLSAYSNTDTLLQQILTFQPQYAVIVEYKAYLILNSQILHNNIKTNTKILYGIDSIIKIISDNYFDLIINGIIGIVGLKPTVIALKMGYKIAMANKESIICGMTVLNKILKGKNKLDYIIPLDSEHFSLLKIFDSNASHFAITASGGPFFNNGGTKSHDFSIENAINHPNWKMGAKISVDSANLMNKVLEVFEANCLFNISIKNIEIIIHPQSIVHAISYYADGSQKIFVFPPDMKIPIASALQSLFNRENKEDNIHLYTQKYNLIGKNLEFFEPSIKEFPSLNLLSNNQYISINASNEVLVQAFLNRKIKFQSIVDNIFNILSKFSYNIDDIRDENDILDIDSHVRNLTNSYLDNQCPNP